MEKFAQEVGTAVSLVIFSRQQLFVTHVSIVELNIFYKEVGNARAGEVRTRAFYRCVARFRWLREAYESCA